MSGADHQGGLTGHQDRYERSDWSDQSEEPVRSVSAEQQTGRLKKNPFAPERARLLYDSQILLPIRSLLLNHLPGQNLVINSQRHVISNDHVLALCSFGLIRPN